MGTSAMPGWLQAPGPRQLRKGLRASMESLFCSREVDGGAPWVCWPAMAPCTTVGWLFLVRLSVKRPCPCKTTGYVGRSKNRVDHLYGSKNGAKLMVIHTIMLIYRLWKAPGLHAGQQEQLQLQDASVPAARMRAHQCSPANCTLLPYFSVTATQPVVCSMHQLTLEKAPYCASVAPSAAAHTCAPRDCSTCMTLARFLTQSARPGQR